MSSNILSTTRNPTIPWKLFKHLVVSGTVQLFFKRCNKQPLKHREMGVICSQFALPPFISIIPVLQWWGLLRWEA